MGEKFLQGVVRPGGGGSDGGKWEGGEGEEGFDNLDEVMKDG